MPNDMQRAAWTDSSGPRWVAQRAMYDRMLAPFQAEVLTALAAQPGEHIVDIGCGYGTTSLAVAEQVGTGGRVHGVDISATMIAHAVDRSAGREELSFAVADAQTEVLDGGPFDAMISRFGVMFFDDPTVAFANIATAVRPGGRMAFVCWQAGPRNPFFATGRHLRAALTNPPPLPEPNAPSPVAFADPDRTAGLLTAGGWTNLDFRPITPVIRFDLPSGGVADRSAAEGDVSTAVGDVSDGIDNALALVAGSETGLMAARELSPTQLDDAYVEVRADLSAYLVDGVLALPSAAWVVTGVRAS